jgi:N-acetylglutamate synthase-like GNAT family acetyltransferase
MTNSKGIEVTVLNAGESEKVIQTVELLHGSFAGSDRYTVSRLNEELKPLSEPLYRQFFIATAHTKKSDRVIGVGGIKAADWASNTHILYLSAVHPEFRNQGIGKKLVRSRVDWIRENFSSARVLVSTPKIDRFRQFGFKQVSRSCDKGRAIMLMEF